MYRSLDDAKNWYISAVRSALILNFGVMEEEADKAISAYGLRAKIEADPEGELSNSIEGVAEDISRKEFLGRPCSLSYKGFETDIRYDSAIRHLYGKILGIDDFVSFEADPSQDIEAEFHRAVDDYLAYKDQDETAGISSVTKNTPETDITSASPAPSAAEELLNLSDIDFLRAFGIDPEDEQADEPLASEKSEDRINIIEINGRITPSQMEDRDFLKTMGIDPDDLIL